MYLCKYRHGLEDGLFLISLINNFIYLFNQNMLHSVGNPPNYSGMSNVCEHCLMAFWEVGPCCCTGGSNCNFFLGLRKLIIY